MAGGEATSGLGWQRTLARSCAGSYHPAEVEGSEQQRRGGPTALGARGWEGWMEEGQGQVPEERAGRGRDLSRDLSLGGLRDEGWLGSDEATERVGGSTEQRAGMVPGSCSWAE